MWVCVCACVCVCGCVVVGCFLWDVLGRTPSLGSVDCFCVTLGGTPTGGRRICSSLVALAFAVDLGSLWPFDAGRLRFGALRTCMCCSDGAVCRVVLSAAAVLESVLLFVRIEGSDVWSSRLFALVRGAVLGLLCF